MKVPCCPASRVPLPLSVQVFHCLAQAADPVESYFLSRQSYAALEKILQGAQTYTGSTLSICVMSKDWLTRDCKEMVLMHL